MQSIQKIKFIRLLNGYIRSDKNLRDRIKSVYLYGSYLTNEVALESDVDCYIIASEIKLDTLKTIEIIKKKIENKINREVFINVINIEDLDSTLINKGLFVHRERPYMFLFELKNCFKLVYGKDFKKSIKLPPHFNNKLRAECYRLIRNLRYMNYKLIVNNKTKLYSQKTLLKNILFASKIFYIFSENQFNDYKLSVDYLKKRTGSSLPIKAYENLKISNYKADAQFDFYGTSISFYDKLLSEMEKDFIPKENISGCFTFKNFKVYYEASGDLFSDHHSISAFIFLNGLPRPAQIDEEKQFITKAGFIFFNVYYPGYWDAEGEMNFLTLSRLISELGKFIKKGNICDRLDKKEYNFRISKLYLLGSSFGGSLALNINNGCYDKIIAVSPLIDFDAHRDLIKTLFKRLEFLKSVVRFNSTGQKAIDRFIRIDPLKKIKKSSSKLLIIADRNDPQIKYNILKEFTDKNKIALFTTNYNQHGYRLLSFDDVKSQIFNFIK